ncbi:hypothetical protein, partial [Brevundimonas sp.]|uniref:hypothetical protein n=1 Tax=Brevundimonas sp. TaxID=1871086 RepID=UPI002898A274
TTMSTRPSDLFPNPNPKVEIQKIQTHRSIWEDDRRLTLRFKAGRRRARRLYRRQRFREQLIFQKTTKNPKDHRSFPPVETITPQ